VETMAVSFQIAVSNVTKGKFKTEKEDIEPVLCCVVLCPFGGGGGVNAIVVSLLCAFGWRP
jgi:hypothetical protein